MEATSQTAAHALPEASYYKAIASPRTYPFFGTNYSLLQPVSDVDALRNGTPLLSSSPTVGLPDSSHREGDPSHLTQIVDPAQAPSLVLE